MTKRKPETWGRCSGFKADGKRCRALANSSRLCPTHEKHGVPKTVIHCACALKTGQAPPRELRGPYLGGEWGTICTVCYRHVRSVSAAEVERMTTSALAAKIGAQP